MKILHLAAGDLDSGAGQGARWLHRALLQQGVNSELHASRHPARGEVYQEFRAAGTAELTLQLCSRLDRLPLSVRRLKPLRHFSPGFAGINLRKLIQEAKPDVLHLHYINTGFVSIRSLLGLGVPVVWTFRDMWPFTGGCHYSWNCSRYTEACGMCPVLNSDRQNDLSHRIWKAKHNVYRKLLDFYPVAISPWLQRTAKESSLLADREVGMIWNGVDLDNFNAVERAEAKANLGLPCDRPILLLGASRASSVLKGYGNLLQVLSYLREHRKFEVVRFGQVADSDRNIEWVRDLGYISDRKQLNLVYAAADVFLAPSPQEAFGKTVVEALASGTPAIVFDGSGAAEIVQPNECGIAVAQGDFEAFGLAGLAWAQRSRADPNIKHRCVQRSRDFSDEMCARSYLDLYKLILKTDV